MGPISSPFDFVVLSAVGFAFVAYTKKAQYVAQFKDIMDCQHNFKIFFVLFSCYMFTFKQKRI